MDATICADRRIFKGRHFDQELVVLCVRWYLSFKLSYRDLVAMMSERSIDPAPLLHNPNYPNRRTDTISPGFGPASDPVGRFWKGRQRLFNSGRKPISAPNAAGMHFHAALRQKFGDVLIGKRGAKVPAHTEVSRSRNRAASRQRPISTFSRTPRASGTSTATE